MVQLSLQTLKKTTNKKTIVYKKNFLFELRQGKEGSDIKKEYTIYEKIINLCDLMVLIRF